MRLYKVTIRSGNSFYVIAEDETSAYQKVLAVLNDNNLFFSSERTLKMIEFVGDTYYDSNNVFTEIY